MPPARPVTCHDVVHGFDRRRTARCPSGMTRCRARSARASRSTVTPMPTWSSSARASPGCGPPTTWPGPIRRCAWWSASARSPGSARRAATAAGARRCSRHRWPSWSGWAAASRPSPCREPCTQTVDEVGRAAAAEGIDCHFAKGGTVHAGPVPGPARPGPGRGCRGAGVRLRRGRPAAAGRGRDDRDGRRHQRPGRHLHTALRGHSPVPAGPRAGRGRPAGRGERVRAHPGPADRAPAGDHRVGTDPDAGSSSGPPRDTRPACPAWSGPSRRSTR